jgi:hypothetical protein
MRGPSAMIGFLITSEKGDSIKIELIGIIVQKNGYGTKLLDYVIKFYTENPRFSKLLVQADPNAIGYYRKKNFITVDEGLFCTSMSRDILLSGEEVLEKNPKFKPSDEKQKQSNYERRQRKN